jgi:molybdate transport system ATP-binding protein
MIWDVDLLRVLRHGESRFDVSVRFASDAPRLVLHGPSGAGKTQTLKMIAGIVRPDRGRIGVAGRTLFDGTAGLRLSPQQRRLGYMFQDYALFPHLSVRQNIAFGRLARWLNPSRSHSDAAVDRWIETFHLESVAGHYPHQLSGGQRQRTALARALVNDPTALLLDEPFAALDNSLRHRLRLELKDLQAQLRTPMLLVTHDDEDIRLLADDVVHLHAGQVVDGARAVAATEAPA